MTEIRCDGHDPGDYHVSVGEIVPGAPPGGCARQGQGLRGRMLDCGHPAACLCVDDEGDFSCAWCDDLAHLAVGQQTLRQQLEKTAVIVHGGSPVIVGQIGLLEIRGGEAKIYSCGRVEIDPAGRISLPLGGKERRVIELEDKRAQSSP